MAKSKATHEVIHASLYLMIDGKLQQVPIGTLLPLSGKKAADLEKRGFVKKLGSPKQVDPADKE
jgi:hypothetical protein